MRVNSSTRCDIKGNRRSYFYHRNLKNFWLNSQGWIRHIHIECLKCYDIKEWKCLTYTNVQPFYTHIPRIISSSNFIIHMFGFTYSCIHVKFPFTLYKFANYFFYSKLVRLICGVSVRCSPAYVWFFATFFTSTFFSGQEFVTFFIGKLRLFLDWNGLFISVKQQFLSLFL